MIVNFPTLVLGLLGGARLVAGVGIHKILDRIVSPQKEIRIQCYETKMSAMQKYSVRVNRQTFAYGRFP